MIKGSLVRVIELAVDGCRYCVISAHYGFDFPLMSDFETAHPE